MSTNPTKTNSPLLKGAWLGLLSVSIIIILLFGLLFIPNEQLIAIFPSLQKSVDTNQPVEFIQNLTYQTRSEQESYPITSENQLTLMAVGDVMLGRSVNTSMIRREDWRYPFLETAAVLRESDVLFGNLESPFGFNCPYTDEGMIFCADQRSVEGLVFAGFDVLSLANNHALNQGAEGLQLSVELLENNDIAAIPFGESTVIEKNNIRLGFIAFDDTLTALDTEVVGSSVSKLADTVDLVVTSFHWGDEYTALPSDRQKTLANVAAHAGSELIVGHHPHWIQSIEEIPTSTGKSVVFYSLGNFVFDQMWSEETRTGMVARFEISKEGIESYQTQPVTIFDYSQPRFNE